MDPKIREAVLLLVKDGATRQERIRAVVTLRQAYLNEQLQHRLLREANRLMSERQGRLVTLLVNVYRFGATLLPKALAKQIEQELDNDESNPQG